MITSVKVYYKTDEETLLDPDFDDKLVEVMGALGLAALGGGFDFADGSRWFYFEREK